MVLGCMLGAGNSWPHRVWGKARGVGDGDVARAGGAGAVPVVPGGDLESLEDSWEARRLLIKI